MEVFLATGAPLSSPDLDPNWQSYLTWLEDAGRALDAGPLASARALEGLTAVIVNLNKRYRAHAGIRVTGIS